MQLDIQHSTWRLVGVQQTVDIVIIITSKLGEVTIKLERQHFVQGIMCRISQKNHFFIFMTGKKSIKLYNSDFAYDYLLFNLIKIMII